jgi:hypothetical protein
VLRVCLLPVHSFLVVKGLQRCRKGAEHARIPFLKPCLHRAMLRTLSIRNILLATNNTTVYTPSSKLFARAMVCFICTRDGVLYLHVRCCDISSCADAGPPSSSLDVLLFL